MDKALWEMSIEEKITQIQAIMSKGSMSLEDAVKLYGLCCEALGIASTSIVESKELSIQLGECRDLILNDISTAIKEDNSSDVKIDAEFEGSLSGICDGLKYIGNHQNSLVDEYLDPLKDETPSHQHSKLKM